MFSVKEFVREVPVDESMMPLWSENTSEVGSAFVGSEIEPLDMVMNRGVAFELAVPVMTGVAEPVVSELWLRLAVGATADTAGVWNTTVFVPHDIADLVYGPTTPYPVALGEPEETIP